MWQEWDVPRAPTPAERKIIKQVVTCVRNSGFSDEQITKGTKWHPKRWQRMRTGETRIRVTDIQTLSKVLHRPIADLVPDLRRAA